MTVFHMVYNLYIYLTLFFKDFIYLCLERGEGERKRGKETSMCGCLSCTPLNRELACNPSMCPDWESNL